MPEPDLAIVAGDFKQRRLHPPESALLVIEASDSTVALDRGAKSSAYAALGVREYWLVDINGERLEIRSKPAPSEDGTGWKYEDVEIYEKSARNSAGVAPHFDSALIVPWDYMFAEAAEQ